MTFARASAWRWKVLMATVGSLALMIGAQAAPESTTAKPHAAKTSTSKNGGSESAASKTPAPKKPESKATAAKSHAEKAHGSKTHSSKTQSSKTQSRDKSKDHPSKSHSTKTHSTKSHSTKSATKKPASAKSHSAPASATLQAPTHRQPAPRVERRPSLPSVVAATSSTSQADLGALQNVVDLVRRGKQTEATQAEAAISDPVARKLAEWIILRSGDNGASVERYRAFSGAQPGWPSPTLRRRRAEAALWDDRRDDATVLAWFQNETPLSYKGKLVLARALLGRGDRATAERLVRDAWLDENMPASIESVVLDQLGALLRPADHKARMDALLYDDANDAALRAG